MPRVAHAMVATLIITVSCVGTLITHVVCHTPCRLCCVVPPLAHSTCCTPHHASHWFWPSVLWLSQLISENHNIKSHKIGKTLNILMYIDMTRSQWVLLDTCNFDQQKPGL